MFYLSGHHFKHSALLQNKSALGASDYLSVILKESFTTSPYNDSRIINGTAIQYKMSDAHVDPQFFSGFSCFYLV